MSKAITITLLSMLLIVTVACSEAEQVVVQQVVTEVVEEVVATRVVDEVFVTEVVEEVVAVEVTVAEQVSIPSQDGLAAPGDSSQSVTDPTSVIVPLSATDIDAYMDATSQNGADPSPLPEYSPQTTGPLVVAPPAQIASQLQIPIEDAMDVKLGASWSLLENAHAPENSLIDSAQLELFKAQQLLTWQYDFDGLIAETFEEYDLSLQTVCDLRRLEIPFDWYLSEMGNVEPDAAFEAISTAFKENASAYLAANGIDLGDEQQWFFDDARFDNFDVGQDGIWLDARLEDTIKDLNKSYGFTVVDPQYQIGKLPDGSQDVRCNPDACEWCNDTGGNGGGTYTGLPNPRGGPGLVAPYDATSSMTPVPTPSLTPPSSPTMDTDEGVIKNVPFSDAADQIDVWKTEKTDSANDDSPTVGDLCRIYEQWLQPQTMTATVAFWDDRNRNGNLDPQEPQLQSKATRQEVVVYCGKIPFVGFGVWPNDTTNEFTTFTK